MLHEFASINPGDPYKLGYTAVDAALIVAAYKQTGSWSSAYQRAYASLSAEGRLTTVAEMSRLRGAAYADPSLPYTPKPGSSISSVAESYFGQNRQFWSKDPVNFKGNFVYQRNDLFDPLYKDPKSGKTNLELMKGGRAPIGFDGKSVQLHHMLQTQTGPVTADTVTVFAIPIPDSPIIGASYSHRSVAFRSARKYLRGLRVNREPLIFLLLPNDGSYPSRHSPVEA